MTNAYLIGIRIYYCQTVGTSINREINKQNPPSVDEHVRSYGAGKTDRIPEEGKNKRREENQSMEI